MGQNKLTLDEKTMFHVIRTDWLSRATNVSADMNVSRHNVQHEKPPVTLAGGKVKQRKHASEVPRKKTLRSTHTMPKVISKPTKAASTLEQTPRTPQGRVDKNHPASPSEKSV